MEHVAVEGYIAVPTSGNVCDTSKTNDFINEGDIEHGDQVLAATQTTESPYPSIQTTGNAFYTGTTDRTRKLLKEPSRLSNRRKFILGLIIVLIVAGSWVGATQTAKSSYTGGFSAPYFVTWFSTAWMILVFPLTTPLYFVTSRAKFNLAGIRDMLR